MKSWTVSRKDVHVFNSLLYAIFISKSLYRKIILKITLENSNEYILKIVREKEHPLNVISAQSQFSEKLRECGITVPKRYFTLNNEFAVVYKINEIECVITLEDFIGKDIMTFINEYYIKELAKLMARTHLISEENNCSIGIGTIWDFYNIESDIVQGYRKILKLEKEGTFGELDLIILNKIKLEYETIKSDLKQLWDKLPRAAVQGDFSDTNIILKKG